MTLFRQITAVFTLFFLSMLAVVLLISFSDSRDYIENELYTKAQNTASTLAVTMSQTKGDVTKMSIMADAVFDTGYYRSIVFKDMQGNMVFEKSRESVRVVPSWFASMVRLEAESARAQVSDGWKPLGILTVTSDPSESLAYLYGLFKKILLVFLFSALVAILIIAATMKRILKPVENMEKQAEGVLKNRFALNKDIPRTTELKRMTLAMNALVERMKQMHEKLVALTKRNRELEYGDPVTGLHNRRYFTVHYDECIAADDNRSNGIVTVFHLTNTMKANKIIGYDRVNELFRQIAQLLSEKSSDFEESVVCRISGLEIAWLIPGMDAERAQSIASDLLVSARERINRFEAIRDVVCLAVAVVPYSKERRLDKLFSTIDLTINAAITLNCDGIKTATFEDALPLRKAQWHDMIEGAIAENRLKPVLANIFSENGRDLSAELLFDLVVDEKEQIPYRVYAPMMIRLDLFSDYVTYAFEYLLKEGSIACRRISMEMPVEYLDTTHEFEKLLGYLRRLRKTGREFVVEIGQSSLIHKNVSAIEAIVDELSRHDVSVAITRFDANARMLELLHRVRPVYVKMHAGQFIDMGDTFRDSLTLLLQSIGTKLLITGVESKEELEKIEELGSDYFIV